MLSLGGGAAIVPDGLVAVLNGIVAIVTFGSPGTFGRPRSPCWKPGTCSTDGHRCGIDRSVIGVRGAVIREERNQVAAWLLSRPPGGESFIPCQVADLRLFPYRAVLLIPALVFICEAWCSCVRSAVLLPLLRPHSSSSCGCILSGPVLDARTIFNGRGSVTGIDCGPGRGDSPDRILSRMAHFDLPLDPQGRCHRPGDEPGDAFDLADTGHRDGCLDRDLYRGGAVGSF